MRRLLQLGLALVLTVAATTEAPRFELTSPRGLDFVLENSPTPQKYLIETMPGGVALLDYNNDGLLDIFVVNGGHITSPATVPDNFNRHDPKYWNRLYRQNRDGTFTDVTKEAGLTGTGYDICAAVADYDNDGYPDLLSAEFTATRSITTMAMEPSRT